MKFERGTICGFGINDVPELTFVLLKMISPNGVKANMCCASCLHNK